MLLSQGFYRDFFHAAAASSLSSGCWARRTHWLLPPLAQHPSAGLVPNHMAKI